WLYNGCRNSLLKTYQILQPILRPLRLPLAYLQYGISWFQEAVQAAATWARNKVPQMLWMAVETSTSAGNRRGQGGGNPLPNAPSTNLSLG
nr:envelope glycoprotein [Human immunodeficiency virus 2]